MLKKSKKVLSFTLSILIFTSIFFSFPITTNAAVVEESGVGAGNQNVIDAQTWLNNTYSGRAGYTPIDIDGVSYSTTFITLVKAFQIELGFPESKITGTFGSQTKAASPTFEINKTNNNNMVRILQYGLRCKGYYDTNITGVFDTATQSQIVKLQQDAGLSDSQISKKATPLVLQAALSTEIYVLAEGGDTRVQEVQRELNRDYLDYIGIQPCDGIFGPNTVDSLITALQACEGLPRREDVYSDDDVYANGYFGNTTKRCCPSIPYNGNEKKYGGTSYSSDEITKFTKLLQYSLCCLKPNEYDPGSFDGTLSSSTVSSLKKFQKDVALSQTGDVGINEWMALLVSTGNPERPGTAIDCSTRLTAKKAAALKNAGYTAVGRYLTGDLVMGGKRVAKNLLRGEMQTIFDTGLNLFVIFQDAREGFAQHPDTGTYEDLCKVYFTGGRGYSDAEKAFSVAKTLGVPRGEIIYFTVDYDFVKYEVNEKILPYFEGIKNYADSHGNEYRIGIYSARNTCKIVSDAGYSESSFVSDMSTGYSGNKGYPLPDDWAFDQIQETDNFYSSDGSFAIDKDVVSGRYNGFNHFEKDKDNEWDLISEPCSAYVLKPKDDNAIPIPVYWAKVQSLISYMPSLEYSMYDSISGNSIIVMKEHNSKNGIFTDDKIQYVYFRDKGGNLNAGYISTELLYEYYGLDEFQNCAVYRGNDYGTDGQVYYGCDGDSDYNYEFILKNTLKSYGKNGEYIATLPVGTKIRLLKNAVTDGIYANRIQVSEKLLPNSSAWVKIDSNNSYGYIDLGFEIGVLPKDRALLTEYSIEFESRKNSAIYFLPGYLATQLYKSDSDELVWVDLGLTSPLISDVASHGLENWEPLVGLDMNGNGDKLKVSRELDSQRGTYGTVFDGVDTAEPIMSCLKEFAPDYYTVEFFAYDWRKDLKLSEQELREDIQRKGYKNVSFVCHSTGGLLAASYIAESINRNEQNEIDKVITLGSPLFGTFTSHEALELGKNDALKIMGFEIPYINDWAKKAIRNTPCSYQLLPSKEFFITNQSYVVSNANRLFPSITTIDTIDKFYDVLNRSFTNEQTLNHQMTDGLVSSHKNFREEYLYGMEIFDVFNHVNALHIAGNNVETKFCAIYEETEGNLSIGFSPVKLREYLINRDGDGTVSLDSATMTYIDKNGTEIHPKNCLIYNEDHGQLINRNFNGSENNVFKSIKDFLKDGTVKKYDDTAKYLLRSAIEAKNRLGIYIEGKADIYIYDSSGAQVSSITNGDSYSDFNDDLFTYTFINEEKGNLYIPSNGYKVGLKAREETEVSILIKILDDESKTLAAIDFDDISTLSKDEIITLNAVSGITKDNINNLTLLCGNTTISKTDVKTDYAQSLTVDQNKNISIGTTVQLTYRVSPANTTVNWSSSDESVATVNSNGVVTAVNYGYAVISATTSDGNITENCYICVPCNATSISFTDKYKFVTGGKYEITPTFTPIYATNTDLTFASSDNSVISVDNELGVLKAESEGTATITATTDNGKKAKCVINVVDKLDKTVSGIILSPSSKTITVDDEVTFTATVENDDAINQNLSWSIENSDVAIIESIKDNKCIIKAVGYGETKLIATADDGSCSSQATIIVNEPGKVVIHYHNSKGWDTPYIYYTDNLSYDWQIKPMLSSGDGWYVYTVKDTDQINALFYDNDSEENISTDESYSITGEKWILKGNVTAEQPEGIKVHYYCVNNWNDPHIYYYNDDDHELLFPGEKMSPDGGNNWYTYTIYGLENPRVIFNNNTTDPDTRQQRPGINQPGIEIIEDEMWIVNETAYSQKPQGITVHFYRPADWEYWNTRIYFYEDNNILMEWPGTLMNSQMYDNWLTYTIYGIDNPKVIFNDSQNKQIPGVLQEGHLVTRDVWYKDGIWSTYKP